MLYEKKKLILHKTFWIITFIISIIIPIIITNLPTEEVEIIEEHCYIDYYYESLNETNCEVEIVCNIDVYSGDVKVAFYDIDGILLATEVRRFEGYDNKSSSTFYSIPGKVYSYQILAYEIEAENYLSTSLLMYYYLMCISLFVPFIFALLLSCKVYEYNGLNIIVYSGWYHHYIKVEGIKLDERNALFHFSVINLSCNLDDGTELIATITMTDRITLKINGKLYPRKK